MGVHTQNVESYWDRVKIKLKRMRGCHAQQLPGYLDEFMWCERYGRSAGSAFTNLMSDIATQYPVWNVWHIQQLSRCCHKALPLSTRSPTRLFTFTTITLSILYIYYLPIIFCFDLHIYQAGLQYPHNLHTNYYFIFRHIFIIITNWLSCSFTVPIHTLSCFVLDPAMGDNNYLESCWKQSRTHLLALY